MNMEKEIQILNIDDILPNRFQPRIQFNDRNINELADSIKEHGVIQPIVVRKVSDKYEIIAGERRYKASILAGKNTIPAIVTNLDDKNSAEIALIENVQRQDLTAIEEAVSYKKILDMGYLTQSELADKLGKTQSTIANKLRLLNLDDEVQEALLDGKISERHARSLLKLDNSHQIIMLNKIIEERLTVRKTDEEIEKMIKSGMIKVSDENSESEGRNMDEKIVNEFNIPSNPIMEEITPVAPVQEETTTEVIKKDENINPGFMDIDKIEENAEDIFKAEQPANLDMLLEKSIEPVVAPINPMAAMQPIIDESTSSTEDTTPKGGRFFNMFGLTQEEDVNPNYVGDLESKETNMDFGMPTSQEPTFNPFAESKEVVNTTSPFNLEVESLSNDQTMSEQSDQDSTQNNFLNPSDPVQNEHEISNDIQNIFGNDNADNMKESDVNPNMSFESNNLFITQNNQNNEPISFNDQEEINESEIYEQPVFEKQNQPSISNMEPVTPIYDDIIEEPKSDASIYDANQEEAIFNPVQSYSLNDENSFANQNTLNNEPILFNDQEEINESKIYEQPVFEKQNQSSVPSMEPVTPIYDDIIEEPKSEPIVSEPILTGTTSMNTEFRTVINTIRDCAKTIEKYGYKIDTEEIDFEDTYQVTFKIDKN